MIFGEKGMDDGTPRTATIVCLTDCDFACLLKKDYDRLLKEITKEQQSKIKDFFYNVVFKSTIPQMTVANLSSDFSKTVTIVNKNQCIFQQG